MNKSMLLKTNLMLFIPVSGFRGILFASVCCLTSTFISDSEAKNLFLVSATIGDGGIMRSSDVNKPLGRASYIPKGMRVSVRPRSGLETLAAGQTLRFGSETNFMVTEEAIVLYEGSLLYRTRKMGNLLSLNGPESEISLDGMGSVMLEVEPNGGFKLIGLLGRVRVTDKQSKRATQLLPGELLFVKPGGRGFGDLVYVNLGKMTKTSFLVSGFKNLSTFERSLATVTKAQNESIAKRFRAVVGDAKEVDTFEVLPVAPDPRLANEPALSPSSVNIHSMRTSTSNPLEEFLGRPPRRLPPRPNSLLKTPIHTPQKEIPSTSSPASKHSLPGRLFELP
jgi:hypothetical protein|tara:strand:+ start:1288 stop:2298 length:1011 start_codon:yes stop_codon:yes gene_type:complete